MINKTIKIRKKSEFSAEFRIDDRYITDNKINIKKQLNQNYIQAY